MAGKLGIFWDVHWKKFVGSGIVYGLGSWGHNKVSFPRKKEKQHEGNVTERNHAHNGVAYVALPL